MKTLWSPWRMKYIIGQVKSEDCIFCRALKQEDGPENLVVWRGKFSFIILNLYPYTNGHSMVVPYEHRDTLEDLDSEVRAEMMELITALMRSLRSIYNPQAFNIGANIGAAAGAGIAAHVHLHVVPRWNGDTNFMSTVGETRVVSEVPAETYRRLRKQLEKDLAGK
jgi:ATP adenylyltransferase